MVIIAVKENSKEAKAFLEYARKLPFITIQDEKKPNAKTLKAIENVNKGKTVKTEGVKDFLKQMNV